MLNALYKSVVSTVGNVAGLGGLPSSMKFHITKKVVDSDQGNSFWEVYEGTSKADGSEVTALVLLKKTASYTEVLMARNAMNRMRTLRHPSVLKVYDAVENDTGVYIVVERCSRLTDFSWREEDRKQPCVWGLYSIISALRFVIVDGKLVHGNIGPQSVFITPKGEFRLGGFELARPISEADGNRLMSDIESSKLTRFLPPRNLVSSNPSAVDLYGLALVAAYLLNGEVLYRGGGSLNPGEDPAASIPSQYRAGFRSLSLHEISRTRDAGKVVSRLAYSGFLKENTQVTIVHFLESQFRLATAAAQDEFFDSLLPNVLPSLPVTMQVTVLLQDLVQVVDAVPRLAAPALVNLTKISAYLNPEQFKRDLLPTVLKLFGSSDRTIRYRLLCNMGVYVEHMDNKMVENTLYPEISSGFNDSHSAIREQTLKSIVLLAPKLKTSTVTNKVLKNLTKLQGDPEPSIRTNTAICIGKISDHFDPAQKPQILLNAFITGMKDSFPPCRVACIQAIQATSSIYDPTDLGGKAMPLLMLRIVDPSPEVQDAAHDAIQPMLKLVREGMLEARREAQLKEDHGEASPHGIDNGATAKKSVPSSSSVYNVFGRFGLGVSQTGPTSGTIGDSHGAAYSKVQTNGPPLPPAPIVAKRNTSHNNSVAMNAPLEVSTEKTGSTKLDLDFGGGLDNVGDDFWGEFDDVPLPEDNSPSNGHYTPRSDKGSLDDEHTSGNIAAMKLSRDPTTDGVKSFSSQSIGDGIHHVPKAGTVPSSAVEPKVSARKVSEGWGDDFDWDNF